MADNREMMEIFMNKVYANIYNTIAPKIGNEQEPSYLLHMLSTGLTLEDTFDVNTLGNEIPAVSKNYTDSQRKVQDIYRIILSAVCPPDDETEAARKKSEYENALKVLYKDVENMAYSKRYEMYLLALEEYNTATYDYYTEYNKNAKLQDKLALKKYKDIMNLKYQKLASCGKGEIENALNTVAVYKTYTPDGIFKKAQAEFGNVFDYSVKTIPENWTDETSLAELAWKKTEISSSYEASSIHTQVKNTNSSFSSEYKRGFWIFYSERGSSSSEDSSMTSQANSTFTTMNVHMTMEIAVIKLLRDWLDLSLLGYPNVYLPGHKPGSITNGTLNNTDNCVMPVIPDFLVLVRNVKIYGDFSEEVKDFLKTAKSHTESGVSFGPFSTSPKSYHLYESKDDTDTDWKRFASQFKIDFGDRAQILGILSTVVKPSFPKKDGTSQS